MQHAAGAALRRAELLVAHSADSRISICLSACDVGAVDWQTVSREWTHFATFNTASNFILLRQDIVA